MYYNSEKLDRLLRETGAHVDDQEGLRRAVEDNPEAARALGRLTEEDIARISAILNDRQALKNLMSTAKAQALLKKIRG